jgi:hypothetical protein
MLTGEALDIVLKMAKKYNYNLCGGSLDLSSIESEAIEEVEFLLTCYEDTGSYTEDDYMEERYSL